MSRLSHSTFSFANNTNQVLNDKNNIFFYINNSRSALREVEIDTSSIYSRQRFLNQLDMLVNKFHSISESSSTSKLQKMSLDRLALSFMGLFNDQNKRGTDYNNNLGKKFI